MSIRPKTVDSELWDRVEIEQRKDVNMKRISVVAWTLTGAAILAYAAIVISQFLQINRLAAAGVYPEGEVWTTLTPLMGAVGVVSLFVAILATVGVFFRLRTSSLHEIQVRLSALEEIVVEHLDRTV